MNGEITTVFVPIQIRVTSSHLDNEKDREKTLEGLINHIKQSIRTTSSQCQIEELCLYPGKEIEEGLYEYSVSFVLWGAEAHVMNARRSIHNSNASQVYFNSLFSL